MSPSVRRLLIVLVALGGFLPGGPLSFRGAVAGEDEIADAGLPERVAQWLEDLGADRYAVREAARRQLERRGAEVRGALEARQDDADPEIRRAVRLLLDRLGNKDHARVEAAPPGDLEALGRLTLQVARPLPLGTVLARIGEPFGASFVLPPGRAGEVANLDLEGLPFFQALFLATDGSGLAPRGPFEPGGALTLEAGRMAQPWAAAGPLRVRVTEVTSTRVLGSAAPRRRVLQLQIDWPPAFQVLSWQTPLDVEGVDSAGGRYRAAPPSLKQTTYGVGATSTSGRFPLHLEGDGKGAETLAHLTFRLPVRLRHARRHEVFEAPFEDLPRKVEVSGGGTLTLVSVTPPPNGRGPWGARVVARLPGPVAPSSLQVWFRGPDGKRRAGATGSLIPSADGRLEVSARAFLGHGGETPDAVALTWFEQEDHGSLTFRLDNVPLR